MSEQTSENYQPSRGVHTALWLSALSGAIWMIPLAWAIHPAIFTTLLLFSAAALFSTLAFEDIQANR